IRQDRIAKAEVMERIECVVVGAGVVGLACTRQLARQGLEVVVLEAARAIGTGTSSRNSEVIHAGIYYPQDSLKARSCVRGKKLLYDYLESRGIAHRRCGKLIVATEESQLAVLKSLQEKAARNGVDDLRFLTAAEARALEPELATVGALLSPSTGILDSHGLMLSYQGEAEDAGAMLAFDSPLLSGEVTAEGILLQVGGEAAMEVLTARLVNAAGLQAPDLAARIRGLPTDKVPKAYYCKGSYYKLAGAAPFSHLIYPVPEAAGLGVHLTLDLGGQARFGPDTEWVDDPEDLDVDPARAESFYEAVRRYWPGLADGALLPDYAGMRPKLTPPGAPPGDFLIQGPADHGVPGLVNLFGIESPGLTASLALAEIVAKKLEC